MKNVTKAIWVSSIVLVGVVIWLVILFMNINEDRIITDLDEGSIITDPNEGKVKPDDPVEEEEEEEEREEDEPGPAEEKEEVVADPNDGIIITDPKEGDIITPLEFDKFGSYLELKTFLEENTEYSVDYGCPECSVAAVPGAVAADSVSAGSISGDYSATNVQVEGVDEPDIVKNDGKYIYTLSEDKKKLFIVDAFPAQGMNLVSEIDLSNRAYEFFVNDNRLVVFTKIIVEEVDPVVPDNGILFSDPIPGYYYPPQKTRTGVEIYDISNKASAALVDTVSADGRYKNARMVGDYVYVIASQVVNINDLELPVITAGGVDREVDATEIYNCGIVDTGFSFTNILAFNLRESDIGVESKTFLTGSTNAMYMSHKNIFLTNKKRVRESIIFEGLVEEVIKPLVPVDVDAAIDSVMESEDVWYEEQSKVYDLVEEYSRSLIGEEKENFDKELLEKTEEYNDKNQKEFLKTVIHKIGVDKSVIVYRGSGEVIGRVLNQFSMDEFNGNFRIATTTGSQRDDSSLNHLFVLDENLKGVGGIEDIAKGEKIHSVRFMGGKAYMVTFKKIDPFFVIDVESPEDPKILGYLKIPGFSDYLHPFDENHIIGVGKETVEASDELKDDRGLDFAWFQGIKISLFDVSDVENPKEKTKIIIGDRGTDSISLKDHKAFLFDKERELLVIPILLAEIDEGEYGGEVPPNVRGERIWQGAFVLNIDENDISERGRITHYDEVDFAEGNSIYWGPKTIERSLYMDDYLYTVSDSKIKANEIVGLAEVNELILAVDR
jgi:inhibitor of cysteine peptidase